MSKGRARSPARVADRPASQAAQAMFGNEVPIKTSPLVCPSRLAQLSRPRIENQSRLPQASPMSPPASPTKRFIGPAVSPLLRPVRTATPAPNTCPKASNRSEPKNSDFYKLLVANAAEKASARRPAPVSASFPAAGAEERPPCPSPPTLRELGENPHVNQWGETVGSLIGHVTGQRYYGVLGSFIGIPHPSHPCQRIASPHLPHLLPHLLHDIPPHASLSKAQHMANRATRQLYQTLKLQAADLFFFQGRFRRQLWVILFPRP